MSIRDRILQADDLQRRAVPTPEWPELDGQLYARALGGDERDAWETFTASLSEVDPNDKERRRMKPGSSGIRAKLVCMGTCDAHGDAVFQDGDEARLGLKNAAALDRLDDAIRELSGMDQKGGDAGKNSPTGNSSSTDSPSDLSEPNESCCEVLPAES